MNFTKIQITVQPQEAANSEALKKIVARQFQIPVADITDIQIEKKSIDARHRQPKINLQINVFCGEKS
ncbi:MAG: FAD-binding protein, partial [Prevotellaceae bacterium]|nr:FAD-binding protein [Prevotellaceae bacterium]